jgi:hypothetical protein
MAQETAWRLGGMGVVGGQFYKWRNPNRLFGSPVLLLQPRGQV